VSKGNGFLQLRRGVFEHVRDGRMTMTEAFCYIYMLTQADTRTGIWNGSAGALSGELAMPQRTARNILEALDHRYIKRFTTPGRHSCYPIALHKFLVTDGEHIGKHLNALESESPTQLRYFSREQMGEQEGQHMGQQMAAQKKLDTRDKRNNLVAKKTSPPADGRFKPFIEFAFIAFEGKYNYKPTWGTGEFTNLSKFLKQHPEIQYRDLSRAFTKYLASDSTYYAEKGHKLTVFLKDFDGLRAPDDAPRNGSPRAVPHIPTAADCRPAR
jgi:hypothetical protein